MDWYVAHVLLLRGPGLYRRALHGRVCDFRTLRRFVLCLASHAVNRGLVPLATGGSVLHGPRESCGVRMACPTIKSLTSRSVSIVTILVRFALVVSRQPERLGEDSMRPLPDSRVGDRHRERVIVPRHLRHHAEWTVQRICDLHRPVGDVQPERLQVPHAGLNAFQLGIVP